MLKLLFFDFVLVFFVDFRYLIHCEELYFERIGELSDHKTTKDLLKTFVDISLIQCSVHCLQSKRCESFFFNSVHNDCSLHTNMFSIETPTMGSPGTEYYEYRLATCPEDDGYFYDDISQKCIKPYAERKNYTDATHTCINNRGRLMKIETYDDWTFLHHVIGNINYLIVESYFIQGNVNSLGFIINDNGDINIFLTDNLHPGKTDMPARVLIYTSDLYYPVFYLSEESDELLFICEIYLKQNDPTLDGKTISIPGDMKITST